MDKKKETKSQPVVNLKSDIILSFGNIRKVKVKDLISLPGNSLTLDTSKPKDIKALAADISQRNGLLELIITANDGRTILSGNRRRAALMLLGWDNEVIEVRPIKNDLTKEEMIQIASGYNSGRRITPSPTTLKLKADCVRLIPNLELLIKDGKISQSELAVKTGLNIQEAGRVIKKLSEECAVKMQMEIYPKQTSADKSRTLGNMLTKVRDQLDLVSEQNHLESLQGKIIAITKKIERKLAVANN